MKTENRNRHGYLWATDKEIERIKALVKSSNILKSNEHIATKADFVRLATITLGELLKKKKIHIPSNATQEDIVALIVKSCV